MNQTTHYIVPAEALQHTTSYLASQPYGEVVELFNMLRQSKPYVSAPPHPNDELGESDAAAS